MSNSVLTIGYGSRTLEEVIKLLRRHDIQYLIDVRSVPFSRHQPDFSKEWLERALTEARIRYVFMGDTLGGRPSGEDAYSDGRVDYSAVQRSSIFKAGMERLQSAAGQGLHVCLICSEGRPENCHRSKLIGDALTQVGIDVRHVDVDGQSVSQSDVMDRLTGGQDSFFDAALSSRKRYKPR